MPQGFVDHFSLARWYVGAKLSKKLYISKNTLKSKRDIV
jgi:hypothetical protein